MIRRRKAVPSSRAPRRTSPSKKSIKEPAVTVEDVIPVADVASEPLDNKSLILAHMHARKLRGQHHRSHSWILGGTIACLLIVVVGWIALIHPMLNAQSNNQPDEFVQTFRSSLEQYRTHENMMRLSNTPETLDQALQEYVASTTATSTRGN